MQNAIPATSTPHISFGLVKYEAGVKYHICKTLFQNTHPFYVVTEMWYNKWAITPSSISFLVILIIIIMSAFQFASIW